MGSGRRTVVSGGIIAAAVAAIIILGGGFAVGRMVNSDGPAALVEPGTLTEVRLASDASLIGAYAGSAGDLLIPSMPAANTVHDSPGDSVRTIRSLSTPPDSLSGNVLVLQDQIILIGGVAAGSDLESRYHGAVGVSPVDPTPDTTP